jgi:hypothetical protein
MADTLSFDELQKAHQASSQHRAQIDKSDVCGCFYCLKTFAPADIREWWDNGQTAVCPHCGIDSVLGSASGVPLSAEFLAQMQKYWFAT